ncbi:MULTISPECIES: 4'-phosphopantetheinyl transferase family protein [Flavobacterium]|uniref:4'-phosphopantetheinyl transferase superfamily protein n=1 Tax=Flavobacterium keumense TaxID=1306518 RepID=A0ABY8N638_9FLAO|nr:MULTISPECIES: 4'-phosphopantetheinyl transferase superfamily protein [Flavobacterium]WGK94987.1 4'-phosphopantetheinyl transferase superfamily protein [Flavobacterium keumense]
MPLYKTIQHNSSTQILIWNITESFEQLNQEVQLNEKSQKRLDGMKSEMHQRAFLSIRKLLAQAGYSDFDLYYDEFGKPHLINEKHISITHSHHFSAIILSNEAVGIDIEMQREKIQKIAHKFVNDKELERLQKINTNDYIKKLTVKWGAKEAIFKIRNEKGISFKDHIQVAPFELNETQTIANLNYNGINQQFTIHFSELDTNFTLVYAFENNMPTQAN